MAKDALMDYEKALELFEPVLGFEVHVELNTKTKMFCGCANEFGSGPNANTCPTCLGARRIIALVHREDDCDEEVLDCSTCDGKGFLEGDQIERRASGERLRAERLSAGKTLLEAAAERGISVVEYSRLERGK